jgi:hypothetical protein
MYYLAAAPEMAEVSGRFFNQTIEEVPARHALDRSLGKRVWSISEKLTGLAGSGKISSSQEMDGAYHCGLHDERNIS